MQNTFCLSTRHVAPRFSRARIVRKKKKSVLCRNWANGDCLLGIETDQRWACKSLRETSYFREKPIFSDYFFLILWESWQFWQKNWPKTQQFLMLSLFLTNQHLYPPNILILYIEKIIQNILPYQDYNNLYMLRLNYTI